MSLFDIFRNRKKIPAPWEKYYRKEDLDIKIPDISMYDQIKESASNYTNCTAYQYFGKKTTYKVFLKQIDRASDAYYKLGVRKGQIVTICLPNIPEAIISVYALNKIGAIANMLHPLSSEEEIKDSLNSTGSHYLVMLDSFYSKIKDIINNTKVNKVIYASAANYMYKPMGLAYKVTQIGKYKRFPINKKYISWNNFLLKYSLNKEEINYPKNGRDDAAVIIHSGGTSGKPKNVVIQNRAFVLATIQEKIVLKNLKPGDSCLAIMPNFHGFGLSVCIHSPLVLGYYSILVPQFDARKFDVLLNQTKPTCILGVPTLYEALSNSTNVSNLDLSKLKYVISGGDMLSQKLEKRVNEYLDKHGCRAKITQGYGLSESLAAVCLACDELSKSGSIGIPFPGNHIKIINPTTRETMPYNEVGEICIHTKAFMSGYLNNESETNTALQIHNDGHIWLHTGDLGYMDEDGFVFCKGRQKRMIISSGYNVYPSHIEEVIESHPAVLQCTVVGIPHKYKQEVPKAFIVLKEGYHAILVKSEIKEYCKKKLAKYMVPYEFVYRKRLPKTKLGKIDFRKLQEDNNGDDHE